MRVLLLQTETPRYTLEAARRLRSQHLYPQAEILLLCSERHFEEFSKADEFDRVLTAPSRFSFTEIRGIRRQIRAFDPDAICCVYTRGPIFRKAKAYFLLSGIRRKLAFDAALDCFEVNLRTLHRLRRNVPRLLGAHPHRALRVAWIHSGTATECRRALEAMRRPRVVKEAKITVLCPTGLERVYAGIAGVDRILTYRSRDPFSFLRSARRLARERPEVVSALFTRRSKFLFQKLSFLLFPGASRLAFNRNLDCLFLKRRRIGATLRLLLESTPIHLREKQRFLFLESEGPEFCNQLLDSLHDPKIAPNPAITVFCNETRRRHFESRPDVDAIVPYRSGVSFENLRALKRLLKADVEIAVAAVTGRPVFRLQKLIFFLYPVRHRLAFNEHLHCRYLQSGPAGLLLARLARRRPTSTSSLSIGRALLKGALFLPRFLYLVVWAAAARRKRAQVLKARASQNGPADS